MSITIKNPSPTAVIVSVFNAGGGGIPFSAQWVDGNNGSATLDTGSFASVGVGVQAQEGGRWIGGDPTAAPYATPGQTVTINLSKNISG